MLLKLGSKGAAVRELQILINASGLVATKIDVDEDFGPQTEKAVKAVQKRLGLVIDGKAGVQTIGALQRAISAPKPNAKPEPDKSAMVQPIPAAVAEAGKAKPPSNAQSLVLLDTARPINEIIVHCAATAEGQDYTVDDIRAWHKKRGFTDIGYHYVIYRDGRVMPGRPVGQVGAHCADKGKNKGTIGISYIGGVAKDGKTPKDTRTPAQRASILWLLAQLKKKHKDVVRITGHNLYAAKACPSFNVANDETGNMPGFVKGKAA
ncbi:MAG TPA: N-acetylmuramoyl-L-alanine amidase [Rhizobiaceae bacterium]|nr:N-acetylmuramoyl-L-alanine amidase [Rhizobiaceae bacterium]